MGDALALLLQRTGDFAQQTCDLTYGLHDFLHGAAGLAHQARAAFHLSHAGRDQLLDLFGRFGTALRQRAHLAGHHGKATPLLSGAGRFHGRIEGQDIGLEGDAFNDLNDVHNLARAAADGIHGVNDLVHHITATSGRGRCSDCQRAGRMSALCVLTHGDGELLHAGCGFCQRADLLLGAAGEVDVARVDFIGRNGQ